jgi:VWFA-related protein
MRHALILFLCAALSCTVVCTVGLAQAPGTLDPARQSPKPQDDDDATFRTQTNVVIVPTTVRDRNGEVVNGLQLQDFELYDNNKLQKITADVREEPISLVVAVQRSSNITEILPKIQKIGSMLNQLLAGQDGEVAVIGFDHRILVMQEFTNESEKLSEAMKKMTPGSAEHGVVDAVDASIRMLK